MEARLRKKLDQLVELLTDSEDGATITAIAMALRGPDSGKDQPGEQPGQLPGVFEKLYRARVARKMKTGAVIRAAAYNGKRVGGQKTNNSGYVILPPRAKWDHYDKHVALAAGPLGIEVRIED